MLKYNQLSWSQSYHPYVWWDSKQFIIRLIRNAHTPDKPRRLYSDRESIVMNALVCVVFHVYNWGRSSCSWQRWLSEGLGWGVGVGWGRGGGGGPILQNFLPVVKTKSLEELNNGPFPASLSLYFRLFNAVWLDSNCGYLASEATASTNCATTTALMCWRVCPCQIRYRKTN